MCHRSDLMQADRSWRASATYIFCMCGWAHAEEHLKVSVCFDQCWSRGYTDNTAAHLFDMKADDY